MKPKGLALVALVLVATSIACAQRDPDYDKVVVPQTRTDARDLGYPPMDAIPDGESGITSLTVAPNGHLYGATSGSHAHLFVLIPLHGYVQPLGVIPDATAVTHAVAVSAAGDVFIGTSPSGHLLKYTPRDEFDRQIQIGKPLPVTDLGQPIPGESIFTLTIDPSANVIYGLTSPNTHFFEYSIASGKFTDLGVVSKNIPEGERFEKTKMMSRMLVVDQAGNVFASGENGDFFRFDAKAQKLERLAIHAPAVPGRESWTEVDAFLLDPSGVIYGGTSDGYLFRLDPEKLTVTNLGKPLNQYRIDGLVRAHDGKLYGVGGDKEEMARIFSYDPSTAAYDVLGFVDIDRRPYYTWQAYEIGAMAIGDRGTVYIGENERISKLYLFYPWQ
ncbi:MAG: NHL repeat-containing protein [Acidobacteriaceae bacterium]